jgi:hypothetical protein
MNKMPPDQIAPLQKLKQGYGYLLDVSADALDNSGFTFVETAWRDQPEWANWVFPVWLFSINSSLICSVSPHYAQLARGAFEALPVEALLKPEILALARTVIDDKPGSGIEWVQCELLFYPHTQPPELEFPYPVEKLQPVDEPARAFIRGFDGGVYGIRVEKNFIAAHAGIKNKELIQEIAVGVEPGYQQRGMGKAVVAYAIADILRQGKVPVYWPDSLENKASYALADSLGFQKVATMLFCAYELPNWQGFPVNTPT